MVLVFFGLLFAAEALAQHPQEGSAGSTTTPRTLEQAPNCRFIQQRTVCNVGDGVSAPKRLSPPVDRLLVSNPPHSNCPCTVLIWAIVGRDGKVHSPKVIRPVSDDLDQAAIQDVRRWKFDPAKSGNASV